MQNMKKYLLLVIMAVCAVTFSSCGKDDEDITPVVLENYILGTWHSYKMDAYANGQSKVAEVTKNNELSAAYIEMVFHDDKTVDMGCWLPNADGTSKWMVETDVYYIHNNVVQICEKVETDNDNDYNSELSFNSTVGGFTTRSQDDPETVTLMFDQSTKDLYVRYSGYVNGMNIVGNLYFKK